ncbi:hypothetical protein AB0F91_25445 [Amycolatopsis sp. NPDC023774]|uniref:hypothetical protein n=1 Tax=Amycolatopsis sp. NPDC023774 TaxID=3155015 RepID=UPI0033C9C2B8
MDLVFEHDPRGETVTRITREEGVVRGLPSYSREFRVLHDLAHAAVERSLGLSGGIAAGGVFDNMTVLRQKPRHDARARSRRVPKAASGSIAAAEGLVGVLHHAVEHHRRPPIAAARKAWLEFQSAAASDRVGVCCGQPWSRELSTIVPTCGQPA